VGGARSGGCRVEAITAPTWVVSGELDDFFPPSGARELADRVVGARQVIYEGSGHSVHWEEPDRFVQDLQVFLGSAEEAMRLDGRAPWP